MEALKPIFTKRGEFYEVTWESLGPCIDMEDAIKRYGGHPILRKAP